MTQRFVEKIIEPMWGWPSVEFLKDGHVIPSSPKDQTSDFTSPFMAACGIKKITDLPWKDGMDAFKFMMSMGIAEQKGITARITINHSEEIKRFGEEVGQNFLGQDHGASAA